MKLRNKKTGGIKDFGNLQVYAESENTDESQLLGNFDSFKQILEYYEDYIPVEPLIKDEKIRKAVRAWAEINDICGVEYGQNAGASWFVFKDYKGREMTNIGFLDRWALSKSENGKVHTLEELCGEEEE